MKTDSQDFAVVHLPNHHAIAREIKRAGAALNTLGLTQDIAEFNEVEAALTEALAMLAARVVSRSGG